MEERTKGRKTRVGHKKLIISRKEWKWDEKEDKLKEQTAPESTKT